MLRRATLQSLSVIRVLEGIGRQSRCKFTVGDKMLKNLQISFGSNLLIVLQNISFIKSPF